MFAASKVVDWLVMLLTTLYLRQKYRRGCNCADQPKFRTAPAPAKVVAKGGYSAHFLARLCVEKFELARPANKICESLRLEGAHLSPGTVAGLYEEAWKLLEPLVQGIYADVRQQRSAHCDETGFTVLDDQQHREHWWLWVLATLTAVALLLDPHRGAVVLRKHYGWDKHPPTTPALTLLTDALSTYARLALECCIIQALCWAHQRRRFRDAGRSYPEPSAWAEQWRLRIVRLYRLHRVRRGAEAGSPEWLAADADLRAHVERMRQDMEGELGRRNLHPGQRGPLEHLRKRRAGYTRCLDDPALPLDNNLAARLLRTPVLCRKNSGLIGAHWAACFAAVLWSVLQTAKCNGLNRLTYLTAYFQACAEHGGKPLQGQDLARFLPWALSAADKAAWSAALPVVLPAGLTLPLAPTGAGDAAATEPSTPPHPATPAEPLLPEAAAAADVAATTAMPGPGHRPGTAEPPLPQAAATAITDSAGASRSEHSVPPYTASPRKPPVAGREAPSPAPAGAVPLPASYGPAAQAATARPARPRARPTSGGTSPPTPRRPARSRTVMEVDRS